MTENYEVTVYIYASIYQVFFDERQHFSNSDWPQMISIGPMLRSLLPVRIHVNIGHKSVEFLNNFCGFWTKLDTKASRRFLERNFATHTRTITNTVYVFFVQCFFLFPKFSYGMADKLMSQICWCKKINTCKNVR